LVTFSFRVKIYLCSCLWWCQSFEYVQILLDLSHYCNVVVISL